MRSVLSMADFVKFAKVRPLPDDNVRAMTRALDFVEETKPAPEPDPATSEASKPQDQKDHPTTIVYAVRSSQFFMDTPCPGATDNMVRAQAAPTPCNLGTIDNVAIRNTASHVEAIFASSALLAASATLACLIIVMARPQLRDSWRTTSTEGTDIVIAMDVSSSMLARDFVPDRFEAAKNVAAQFISGRESDNIGIVIFAGESLTGVPMTVDRSQLLQYLQTLSMNVLEDGTAIGDGIATSLNRLKEGKAKSKSIILLTDGSNNTGVVAPITASEVAKELGVKIYTIGIGTNGNAPYPTRTITGRIEFTPSLL